MEREFSGPSVTPALFWLTAMHLLCPLRDLLQLYVLPKCVLTLMVFCGGIQSLEHSAADYLPSPVQVVPAAAAAAAAAALVATMTPAVASAPGDGCN